jgi:hypothetical protein
VAVIAKNNLSLLSIHEVPMLRLVVQPGPEVGSKQQQQQQQHHLLCQAVFQKIFKFMVCIFNDIVIS